MQYLKFVCILYLSVNIHQLFIQICFQNFVYVTVSKLQELGFSKHDCEKALKESRYQLDQAASWLLENAQPVATSLSPKHKQHEEEDSGGTFEIAGVEVSFFREKNHSWVVIKVVRWAELNISKLLCHPTYLQEGAVDAMV